MISTATHTTWRDFSDREAREAEIASDLADTANEGGF